MTLLALLVCAFLQDARAGEGREVELFNGRDLTGWTVHGDAKYAVEDGAILGRTGGGGHSFLLSDESYGDFQLELDVKPEKRGNSGIQIRSHVNEQGRVFGYQIEIDPSERAWSGGLYDEGRRGWLQSLEGRDEARAAFRYGEWNRYLIECRGPRIRTWINDVPITDHLDPLDVEGRFGLQVHSGQNTRVRWRIQRFVDLGTRVWEPWVAPTAEPSEPPEPVEAFALRWPSAGEGADVVVHFPVPGPGWSPDTGTTVAPGITLSGETWTVRAGDALRTAKGMDVGTLSVCCADGRLRVFARGALLASAKADGPCAGRLVIENPARVERLSSPRQRER